MQYFMHGLKQDLKKHLITDVNDSGAIKVHGSELYRQHPSVL